MVVRVYTLSRQPTNDAIRPLYIICYNIDSRIHVSERFVQPFQRNVRGVNHMHYGVRRVDYKERKEILQSECVSYRCCYLESTRVRREKRFLTTAHNHGTRTGVTLQLMQTVYGTIS